MTIENKIKPDYKLWDLLKYFLYLGFTGFGGPIALVNYMYRDLIENRKWISEQDFKDGLALSQLSPGPMAAQLAIYLGFVHYRYLGASLVGLAFIMPSFLMVLILGIIYKEFGGATWIQAIFYGVSSAVIGIISLSIYRLIIKTLGNINIQSFKDKWLLWLVFFITLLITLGTKREDIVVFILAGVLYMIVKVPPKWIKPRYYNFVLLVIPSLTNWTLEDKKLWDIFLFFLKSGAFVFGSGLAIIPFLHSGLVVEYGWLSDAEFIDAVAVAMITPGPVVVTVGFIGYLVAGLSGACIASLATFLPCYIFTVLPAPYFKKIVKNKSIKYFVEGITVSVIGALTGAVVIMAYKTFISSTNQVDYISILITLITLVFLLKYKVKEPIVIVITAIMGFIVKTYFI